MRDELDEKFDPCPTINVSKEDFEEWCSPWKKSLIVQVLGKKVSFRFLEAKLHQNWVKAGDIRIIDLPQDHFLVQFNAEEDYNFALFEGLWMIADHYLIVQRWMPFFLSFAKSIRKVVVWLRIPNLPIELYNDKFLWRLGSKVRTMLELDKLTSLQSRGRFARICVEIYLDKKLISMIIVLGLTFFLKYEGLHAICFRCGKYGHKKESCVDAVPSISGFESQGKEVQVNGETSNMDIQVLDSDKDKESASKEEASKAADGNVEVSLASKEPSKMNPMSSQVSGVNLPSNHDEVCYGPCMIVKRNNTKKGKQGDKVRSQKK